MANGDDWTNQYRDEVRDTVNREADERQRQLAELQARERHSKERRARNEIILAEYGRMLAGRFAQTYERLVSAGSPGAEQVLPRKKLRAPKYGWCLIDNEPYTGHAEIIFTDGTSPELTGKGKYRLRSLEELSAALLATGYKVDGRVGYDESPRYYNRLDESEEKIREWADKVISAWSKRLVSLLEINGL